MPKCVLVVADDPAERHGLQETIEALGHAVACAETSDQVLAMLKADGAGAISLILLDLTGPGPDARAMLDILPILPRRPPAIVQTSASSIDAAVAAMRAGAVDFVVKPVSPERLEVSIRNALRIEALQDELTRMRGSAKGELGLADLIAGSPAMARVVELGRRAAQSALPILIEGESGTGKELIARAIQGESGRAGKPFVSVNCGSLPAKLVEHTLCGQVSSHTGVVHTQAGKFREADQGTLCLEEIGELPLDLQGKLLHSLKGDKIDLPGLQHPIKVDIRLIATTSQNLIRLVKEGRFREDLYYRLNVFPIWVPPLRERVEDVPEFVRSFIVRFAAEEGKRIDGIEKEALALLLRYSWPGNIRQLENTVFRAVVLADQAMLTTTEFPQIAAHVEGYNVTVPAVPPPRDVAPRIDGPAMLGASLLAPAMIHIPSRHGRDALGIPALSEAGDIRPLEAVEADMIRLAFGRYRGRMTEIAKRLGIGRSTLYRKMREIGLEAHAS